MDEAALMGESYNIAMTTDIISSIFRKTQFVATAAPAEVGAWVLAAAQSNRRLLSLPWFVYQATCQGQATGGSCDPQRSAPVAAAWHLLHCAAKLLDDIEDGEDSSLMFADLSPAQVINAATGLIFISQLALVSLRDLGLDSVRTLEVVTAFNTATSRMVNGQAQDLALTRGDVVSLEHLRKVQEAKSGEFFALSCRTGAMLGDASDCEIAACATFGYNLGMLVQMGDDLRDLWRPRSPHDLAAARCTLPVVFALSSVDADARRRIERLLACVSEDDCVAKDGNALIELQRALAESGAVHYVTLQAGMYYLRAHQALLSLPRSSEAQHEILQLLDRVFPAIARPK